MRSRGPLLAALVLLSLAVPATAGAATITYTGGDHGTVVYAAAVGEALDTDVGYEPGCVTGYDCVTFHGEAISAAPSQCALEASGVESCLLDPNGGGVHVVGGTGNDTVTVFDAGLGGFPAGSPYAVALDGGDGNDHLTGGDAAETLDGGAGLDRVAGGGGNDVLRGGDGNDTLLGDGTYNGNDVADGGDDRLDGGAGDDTLTGDSPGTDAKVGHDVLDGGAGFDTVADDWYRYDGSGNDQDPAPTVTFDGVADDGRPGENDDVLRIEHVKSGVPAGRTATTYAGDDGPNTFDLLFTNGIVRGGGGDDVVTGSDYADTIDGGPGADKLSGGFGADTITGGPGPDDISGDRSAACFYGPIYGTCTIGTGNDTINAQDGERDVVDCGPGIDTAYVDAVDAVANCETVQVAGGGQQPTPPTPTPKPTPPAPAKPGDPARVPHPGAQRLARLTSRGLRLRVRCSRACRVAGRLTADRKTAKRLRLGHRKAVTVAATSRRLRKAGSLRLTLRPGRAVRRRLGHAKVHTFRLTLALRITDGAGGRWTVRRTVKVHR